MKKVILCFIISCLITACEVKQKPDNKTQPAVANSVILDVTDPRSYWPAADKILQLYHCKQTPDAECTFRLRTISDKRLSPIISYQLADALVMEKENSDDDPQFRNKNIIAFYTTVRKGMNDFYSQSDTSKSLDNSECYRAIADELTYLSENKSCERTLIIASDLMEKSDLLDCYNTVLTNPQQIAKQLDGVKLLPQSLTGITVIFLFNPRDRNEDQKFSLIAEAYKQLFETKGAEVKIQANL